MNLSWHERCPLLPGVRMTQDFIHFLQKLWILNCDVFLIFQIYLPFMWDSTVFPRCGLFELDCLPYLPRCVCIDLECLNFPGVSPLALGDPLTLQCVYTDLGHIPNFSGVCYDKVCACSVASVMSNSLKPHEPQPTRLLCPWDSPGKKTGVNSHAFLQGTFPTEDWTCVSCIAGRFFRARSSGKP